MQRYWQIFWLFFKLGCTSFGGPAAHLVFFHQSFVLNKQWLSAAEYAQIVALCQLLPGPASSQTGIAIGYIRGGYGGAVLAWLGFTLPSALLMMLAAYYLYSLQLMPQSDILHTAQLILVAVVGFACWQMCQSYCKNLLQIILMLISTLCLCLFNAPWMQFLLIIMAIIIGTLHLLITKRRLIAPYSSSDQTDVVTKMPPSMPELRKIAQHQQHGWHWLVIFGLGMGLLWLWSQYSSSVFVHSTFAFYSSGALVFGGGHVVLPLLHQNFVTTPLIDASLFEAGYAIAQLMPGPLFSFAAYIGALLPSDWPLLFKASLAIISIFLPSFLLVFACLPYWSQLSSNHAIQQIVLYINAVVCSFLLAMLIPMTQSHILNWQDVLCILFLFVWLYMKKPLLLGIALMIGWVYLLKFGLHAVISVI